MIQRADTLEPVHFTPSVTDGTLFGTEKAYAGATRRRASFVSISYFVPNKMGDQMGSIALLQVLYFTRGYNTLLRMTVTDEVLLLLALVVTRTGEERGGERRCQLHGRGHV